MLILQHALCYALQIELCAVFAPQAERPINYNVAVRVRNKPTPLVLNVKGEGYALQPLLLLELPDDSSLEMSPSGTNNLDYGQVRCFLGCCCGCAHLQHALPYWPGLQITPAATFDVDICRTHTTAQLMTERMLSIWCVCCCAAGGDQ